MKDNYSKRGEIAITILKVVAVGGFAVAVLALPGLAQVLTLFKPKNSYEKYKIKRAYDNLTKQNYIRVYKKNGKDIVEITKKGRKKILQYDYEKLKLKRQKKWDGLWRVVMFDIPESKKYARRALSTKLQKMGFYKFQKSIFVYPYKCGEEIEFVINYFKIKKYVKCMLVKEIEDLAKLKKIFELK